MSTGGALAAEALSYLACTAGYLLLTLMLLWRWRGEWLGGLLVLACALTVAWSGTSAAAYLLAGGWTRLAMVSELLRDAGWIAFLLALLRQWRGTTGQAEPGPPGAAAGDAASGAGTATPARDQRRADLYMSAALLAGLLAVLLVDLASPLIGPGVPPAEEGGNMPFFLRLMAAIVGLVLVENLFRNAPSAHRWSVKFLVLALGGLFAYDFFLYSGAALLRFRDPDLDAARGLINVLVVPLLAVSAARGRDWGVRIHVSRQIAFYSASLLFGGAYLLVMSAAGYYVRIVGGSWGGALQLTFLFAAGAILIVVLVSGRFRAFAKGFVSRHFYSYKYDYREEWLRFIRTLAVDTDDARLEERVIHAVADILDSPEGLLWLRRGDRFEPAAYWNRPIVERGEAADGPLAQWLQEHQSLIDLKAGSGAPLPEWLVELRRAWLVLPLLHRGQLTGFMVLSESRAPRRLDQEDHNLLLTAGRQAASHLAESVALAELLQAKEFETFNRRTTFLVHDLKNLVTQLSLLTANARRHRDNPEFIEDMMATVDSSAAKMRQLLAQLRPDAEGNRTGEGGVVRTVEVVAVLQPLLRSPSLARVVLHAQPRDGGIWVTAEAERFAAVLRNLLENAVDAAGPAGSVSVAVTMAGNQALIEVRDSGPGMDPAFIRDHLFSPFRTTKGEGYGIGAFESREFARQAGGRLEVESSPGKGTVMRLVLPATPPQPIASPTVDAKVDVSHERA
jgi:putative PEP-CTERM system histidine kinase